MVEDVGKRKDFEPREREFADSADQGRCQGVRMLCGTSEEEKASVVGTEARFPSLPAVSGTPPIASATPA